MPQVSKYPVRSDVYAYIEDLLLSTLAKITTKDKMLLFLDGYLTPVEKIMLVKRFAVLIMLGKGYDYKSIQDVLHVSPSTIADANRSFKYLHKECRNIIQNVIQNEETSVVLASIVERIAGEIARTGTNAGVWRYVHQEAKIRKRKRTI